MYAYNKNTITLKWYNIWDIKCHRTIVYQSCYVMMKINHDISRILQLKYNGVQLIQWPSQQYSNKEWVYITEKCMVCSTRWWGMTNVAMIGLKADKMSMTRACTGWPGPPNRQATSLIFQYSRLCMGLRQGGRWTRFTVVPIVTKGLLQPDLLVSLKWKSKICLTKCNNIDSISQKTMWELISENSYHIHLSKWFKLLMKLFVDCHILLQCSLNIHLVFIKREQC